jgi:ketosteroid isomerase-like protein
MMTVTPPGAPAPVDDHGKYIVIERKQPDGSWLITEDIFSSDVPLPAPAP